MRVAWAVLVSMLVLVAAGCGSEDLGAGGTSGATILKPGALVFWETVSDPESDQWERLEELVKRFPDGERWLAELRKELESEENVSWENDVKPGLGDTVAVAVYGKSPADAGFVVLSNPEDTDKGVALIEKLNASNDNPGDDGVTRVVDGWVVASTKEAYIDAALKGDGSQALADQDAFKSGMEELPGDALSRVYVDVAAALEAFGSASPEFNRSLSALGLGELEFAGAWAKAREDGAELAGVLRGEGADKLLGAGEPYASKLLDLVPADAFAFVTFQGRGATAQFDALKDNPLYSMAYGEFERELGVKIDDLVQLFDGEVAFYAAPSAPIPTLALLLDTEDPAQARESASRLLRSLAERAGGKVTAEGDVTTATFEGFTVLTTTVENTLVVTTARSALEDLRAAGDKLSDSDRFKDAMDAAGAPDDYTTLAFVNLGEAIDVITGYATAAGESLPPEIARNLGPLRSAVAWGEQDGDLGKSLLFVEIE